MARVQWCKYENQSLEAFVGVSHLYAKFDCPVAQRIFLLLATAHVCKTRSYGIAELPVASVSQDA